MAPVNLAGLVGDDWDGETVVKKPAALTTSRHRERSARDVPNDRQGRDPRYAHEPRELRDPRVPVGAMPAQGPKPFNPDETVKLNGDIDVEIEVGDETQYIVPPPRRSR